MTDILNSTSSHTRARAVRLLLVGASGLALSAPLAANELLFTTSEARLGTGQRTDQRAGLTQIALTSGGLVSIVDAAEYRINADGSIDLYEGTITVAAGPAGDVVVRMPEGLEGRVGGTGAAGNFVVRENGEASGHALTGAVMIGRGGALQRFAAGEMWRARGGSGAVRQVIANGAQAQPQAAAGDAALTVVPIGGDAGPVAAVRNGIPLGLGDQLAAAGASSDILAAARRIEAVAGNPVLDTFPSGDFALLVAAAGRLEGAYGGTPFPEAQADVIRAYLRFLGNGGAGSAFLASYSRFATDYLDLIRSGGLPSAFAGAGPQDIEAYLAYIRRTGAISAFAARDRVLAETYLAFLGNGGNRDAFARSFTDLTVAFFGFVRGGGDPAAFTGASQAALAQTIAFLRDSGLVVQLGAADRALVEAYVANGGLAFAAQYRSALDAYFAFLATGRRPSEYTAVDQATLRAWLETLADTGLLSTVLGERAGFYAEYLAFLRGGGGVDSFAGLPANIFAGYAVQLDAYFVFLASGRLPSEFSGTDIATLQAWLLQLQAAGALERFLGERAAFFADYAAFVAGGGSFDAFAGLPANIFAGYAADLRAYFDFLAAGGVPSAYTLLTPAQVRAYLAALEAAGATSGFLGDLTAFYREFAIYLAGGGDPDLFAGLPVPPDFPAFAAALNAYALFLQGGGLPSAYTAEDLARLRGFIEALTRSGQLASLLGANADLLTRYFAFIAGGGNPDGFAGLPVYFQYVAALNAYYDFLLAGGVPSGYTALDPATIEAYLAALDALQGGLAGIAGLNRFFVDYFVFVAGGGNPDLFAGLPGNGGGGGPSDPPPPVLTGYTGGYNPETAKITFILGGQLNGGAFVGSEIGFDAAPYTLDANGGLSSYTRQPGGQVRNRGAAQQTDIFGNADAVIGRWTNGTIAIPNTFTFNANQGLHYILTRPAAPNILNTLTGRVDYYQIAATRPTIANGSLAPGVFAAGMAIALGGEYRLAMEGTITMPSASNPYVFSFATLGGLADPSRSESIIGANTASSFFAAIPGSDNAGNCTANPDLCVLNLRGVFAGDTDTIGVSYDARTGAAATAIVGTAIFAAGPTRNAGGGGGGGGGAVAAAPYTGTVQGLRVITSRFGIGSTSIDSWSNSTVTFDADGRIATYTNAFGSTAGSGQPLADGVKEAGSINGAIAWARFLDPANASGPVANTGVHTIVGTPAVNLPASGTVTYNLIGGTRPTTNQGTADPGSFSGSLAVDFATRRVGVSLDVAIADRAWRLATAGGSANPANGGLQIGPGGTTFAGSPTVTGLNAASCTASCSADLQGAFFGSGGSHAGIVYRVVDGAFLARGTGIFAAPGAAGTPVTRIGGTSGSAGAVSPGLALASGQDWSRWSGNPSGGGMGASPSGALAPSGSAVPGLAAIEGIASGSEDRRAANRQAERLMGGMITFATPPAIER